MRLVLQVGYRVRRVLLSLLRIRTRGVKVMVFNDAGELLLIRNTYGDTRLFVLPGGGIGRREAPVAAAAREVREETGLEVRGLTALGTFVSAREGKRDTVHLFKGIAEGRPVGDRTEVAEAAFFPLDALPATTSEGTLRRIEAEAAGDTHSGVW